MSKELSETIERLQALRYEINLKDQKVVKNLVDDHVIDYLKSCKGLKERTLFVDIHICVGFILSALIGVVVLLAYKTTFEKSKLFNGLVTVSYIIYFNGVSVFTYLFRKDLIVEGKIGNSTVKIASRLDSATLVYECTKNAVLVKETLNVELQEFFEKKKLNVEKLLTFVNKEIFVWKLY